jgi:hypothetical protein
MYRDKKDRTLLARGLGGNERVIYKQGVEKSGK